MTILDIDFEWPHDRIGYEIKERKRKEDSTALTDFSGEYIVRCGGSEEKDTPFKFFPTLYMEFAYLDGEAESCCEFAKKYGYLGLYPQRKNNPGPGGESLSDWRRAIINMREAVTFGQNDPRALLIGRHEETEFLHLMGVLVPSPLDGMPSFRIRPRSLLGGMRLQFARVLTSPDLDVKACNQCGEWFEAGGERRRIDAIFCSNKCRDNFNNALKKSKKRKTS